MARKRAETEPEEWEKNVRTSGGASGKFYKPPLGTFTIKVTGRITQVQAFGGIRNSIPTDKGAWSTNSFSVLRAIKVYKEEHGDYVGVNFTFKATGSGIERRYKFVKAK